MMDGNGIQWLTDSSVALMLPTYDEANAGGFDGMRRVSVKVTYSDGGLMIGLNRQAVDESSARIAEVYIERQADRWCVLVSQSVGGEGELRVDLEDDGPIVAGPMSHNAKVEWQPRR